MTNNKIIQIGPREAIKVLSEEEINTLKNIITKMLDSSPKLEIIISEMHGGSAVKEL